MGGDAQEPRNRGLWGGEGASEDGSPHAVGSSPWLMAEEGGGSPPPNNAATEAESSPFASSATSMSLRKRLLWYFQRARFYMRDVERQLGWAGRCGNSSFSVWEVIAAVIVWAILLIVVVQVALESAKARPLMVGTRLSKSMGEVAGSDREFADQMAQAFGEWKNLQEKYPSKFQNFSQYLMEEKMKETRLRRKLNKLSKKSLNMVSSIVVPPAQPPPQYSKEEAYELKWTYLADEKAWPYVGSDKYLDNFKSDTRHYYNSLAVFPHSNRTRLHGLVGIWPNGTRAWQPDPMPPPIDEYPGGKAEALKNGGFYFNLSNALPLDRDGPDGREPFCKDEFYDIASYEDVSVIITFYNEPPSTLLRSVHSVLNRTPPPLLREIILVDDHSNNTENAPGGYIYEYIKLLPKVKLMRQPERRGLVQARLAGAKLAKAPIIVVLDSHIEVNIHWLEPQLKRLKESPKSVVFPQIMSLDSENLLWRQDAGIGCFLSFKWVMQERPYFTKVDSVDPVPSPSMAGGLFAVRRDWFFESGGYDDEFQMWGAENVEMAFRIWMCGGRVECTPCARTYHIYRHGGSGYKSPGEYIRRNRLRTARVWLDEYWQLSKQFIGDHDFDMGPFDKMLDLKERLQCKDFKWFLENVDPKREGTDMTKFGILGEIRNLGDDDQRLCIDEMSKKEGGEPYELYRCHGQLGAQGWFETRDAKRIRNMSHEGLCLGHHFKMTHCDQVDNDNHWMSVPEHKWLVWKKPTAPTNDFDYLNGELFECLGVDYSTRPAKLGWFKCDYDSMHIKWEYKIFESDPNFEGPARHTSEPRLPGLLGNPKN